MGFSPGFGKKRGGLAEPPGIRYTRPRPLPPPAPSTEHRGRGMGVGSLIEYLGSKGDRVELWHHLPGLERPEVPALLGAGTGAVLGSYELEGVLHANPRWKVNRGFDELLEVFAGLERLGTLDEYVRRLSPEVGGAG